jgi:uncharacterized protein (TIGR00369 family)
MRTSVAKLLLPCFINLPPLNKDLPSVEEQATRSASKAPFTDPEKKDYYQNFGAPGFDYIGFDRSLSPGGIAFLGEGRFALANSRAVANPTGFLHGGCTAALVDVLGSCAIAKDPAASGDSCGVATNLEVTFGAAGSGEVFFKTNVVKLGNRIATATVVARDRKGRLVARGTVTKYGKLRSNPSS